LAALGVGYGTYCSLQPVAARSMVFSATSATNMDVQPVEQRNASEQSKREQPPRRQTEEERHAYMARVALEFREEPLDASWASSMSSTLRETFQSDELIRAALANNECRSQTCRVELTNDDPTTISACLREVFHRLGGVLPSTVADHFQGADGHQKLILYMTRDTASAKPPPRRG
jgi:hypothetical protein